MAINSSVRLLAIMAVAWTMFAPDVLRASGVAEPDKPPVDLGSIPDTAKAAREAALALIAGGKRQYEASSVEGCVEEGVTKAYARLDEEKKKKLLTGTAKEVTTSLGTSLVSKLFGENAGRAVSAGSAALEAKEAIDEVNAAQKQVDECIGESIADRKLPVSVLAKRRDIAITDVGTDAAKATASALPMFGGLFGGSKKKDESPPNDTDPTRVTMERLLEIARKQQEKAGSR